MRRFSHISLTGERDQWVEIQGPGERCLLGGLPHQEPFEIRLLKEKECENMTYRTLFFGATIAGLGYNYRSLVGEREHYDEPLLFLKSPASASAHQSVIRLPPFTDTVWVEVELAVVIGKDCFQATHQEASDAILGYAVGSDITARNICGRDHHLACSKALPEFAPIGPDLVTGIDTSDLDMTTFINGTRYQQGNTNDRICNDVDCVRLVSRYLPLRAGDVILTGTPSGAMDSLIQPGDRVEHTIQKVGTLTFEVE